MKKALCALMAAMLTLAAGAHARADQVVESGVPVELSAPSAILVEAETGTVIFSKNADEHRPVASIVKLMTLLLLFEDLESGALHRDDLVTVSSNAASTPGSQALLDAGAQYSAIELIKATIIASANDGAVALAEHASGTESLFVQRMNARAAELGLEDTQYVNCTGLPAQGQHTTARDVALLSCALANHVEYHTFATIWLDDFTHPGGRVTTLTNTNRLVRFYEGCDGFKTGSTEEAKYCLSATAAKNGMRLIAVVLGVPQSQKRFDDARAMLEYGFATYTRTQVLTKGDLLPERVAVTRGARDDVGVMLGGGLSMLLRAGQADKLSLEVQLPDSVPAPVLTGDTLGMVSVLLDGKVVARLPAVAAQTVRMPGYMEGFFGILQNWFSRP